MLSRLPLSCKISNHTSVHIFNSGLDLTIIFSVLCIICGMLEPNDSDIRGFKVHIIFLS